MAYSHIWRARLRQFAAGVDVTARGVTVAVLGRGWRMNGLVRLEGVAYAPLASGAVRGVELVDRVAIVEALCAAFDQLPRSCRRAAARCAMALPASVTQTSSLPLEQLALDVRPDHDDQLLAELEPLALAEAERITGIERNDLAADWRIEPRESAADEGGHVRCLTVTAAASEHLEARIECMTAAGLTLYAVDGDAHAALRAMRYMAAFARLARTPQKPCIALWIGPDGLYGWLFAGDQIVREMRYPSPEYATLADALHALRRKDAPDHALISGEPELLENLQTSVASIGDALACSVLPFECAAFAAGALLSPGASAPDLLHAPAGAVAFGLALRGVSE